METQLPQGITTKQVTDILLRRKSLLVSCILIAVSLGLVRYLTQPKTYQGMALLSYQQQSINPAKMSPDEQAKIKDIVSTLSEVVTSRTSLETIITKEGLYEKIREELPMEDVVDIMRKNITITPSNKGDTFIVTYESTDSEKVARVTNAIASGFIEENMKYREEKATETSTYTQDELDMAKVILDQKEEVMRDYKLKHYNEMPEQRVNNMTRLASLQTQYQSKQESIQELERTRVLIRDQIEVRKQMLASLSRESLASIGDQAGSIETDQMKLERFQRNLEILQERYTDRHPNIISLKKKIAYLEKSTAQQKGNGSMQGQTVSQDTFDTTLIELQAEIKGIKLSIEKINKEKSDTQALIKQYEQWIAASPVREAEWSALTREYGELKRHYDFLVSQNLQAGSALHLEQKQKGSQFKIVDPARTPIKPVKPDFIKIMKFALLGGTIIGGAIAFALETLNTSFKDPVKLSQAFDLEVLCSVPNITLRREQAKSRVVTTIGGLFFLCWAIGLVAAIFYLQQQGSIVL
jgi:polysaccharide chain length determinant protein (PEP-CTERM system associated)